MNFIEKNNVSATGLWKAAIVTASMHKIAELICACLKKPTVQHLGADSGNHQALLSEKLDGLNTVSL